MVEASIARRDGVIYPAADSGSVSGVSWGAVFAGAAGAASLSLILLILGVGLGMSSVSPWAQSGVSAQAFGISTILWITFTQLAASAVGGYLAGRLRKQWTGLHGDEVYFRDTAHGFLAWSIATLVTAAMLASTIGAIVSGGAQAGAALVGSAATTATAAAGGAAATAARPGTASEQVPGTSYFVDSLFRKDPSMAQGTATSPTAATASPMMAGGPDASAQSTTEVARIFVNSLRSDAALPPEDAKYVGQLVAQRTGMSPQDAEKRVTDTYNKLQARTREAVTKAKEAADQARKASAYAALWIFVSLLLGAFVASFMATNGGRQRDL